MINQLLTTAGSFLTDIFGLIGNAFSGVAAIFYTPGVDGAAGQLTDIGQIMAFVVGSSLVGVAIYVLVRLLRSALGRISGAARKVA